MKKYISVISWSFSLLFVTILCGASCCVEETIAWGPCTMPSLQEIDAQCARLEVPLDYANPHGKKIGIAVSRLRHNVTQDKYQGIVLMNPGGPGGSGLDMITLSLKFNRSVIEKYDWIGFDPRGVGESEPVISCMPTYKRGPRPDGTARNANEELYWSNRIRRYVQSCASQFSEILPFMRTIDSANDMESIRKALGVEKINFVGVSYGTYLGPVYATLYPKYIRRIVLDAVVDPRHIWLKAAMNQNAAYDHNFKLWFNWMAKYDNYYKLGNTSYEVEAKWNIVLDSLRLQPINGTIGLSDWMDLCLVLASLQSYWPAFASAISIWYHDNDSTLIINIHSFFRYGYSDNAYAVYLAVLCSDVDWPRNLNSWAIKNWWSYAKAPISTWHNARLHSPCQYWPIRDSKPVKLNGRHVGRALLVAATFDAQTPIEGAYIARKRFPRASLVVAKNDVIHGNLFSGNRCVDNLVSKYLEFGIKPRRKPGNQADMLCSPHPEPEPIEHTKLNRENIEKILTSKKTMG